MKIVLIDSGNYMDLVDATQHTCPPSMSWLDLLEDGIRLQNINLAVLSTLMHLHGKTSVDQSFFQHLVFLSKKVCSLSHDCYHATGYLLKTVMSEKRVDLVEIVQTVAFCCQQGTYHIVNFEISRFQVPSSAFGSI